MGERAQVRRGEVSGRSTSYGAPGELWFLGLGEGLAGELVGAAGGLGEAEAGGRGGEAEGQAGGFVEADAVADGDEDGLDAGLGAQDTADHFRGISDGIVGQRREEVADGAAFAAGFGEG